MIERIQKCDFEIVRIVRNSTFLMPNIDGSGRGCLFGRAKRELKLGIQLNNDR